MLMCWFILFCVILFSERVLEEQTHSLNKMMWPQTYTVLQFYKICFTEKKNQTCRLVGLLIVDATIALERISQYILQRATQTSFDASKDFGRFAQIPREKDTTPFIIKSNTLLKHFQLIITCTVSWDLVLPSRHPS